jgi:hypothetical protein
VLVLLAVVVLLVQPPNSSSAVTLGANPPDAPGTMGWLANEAHPMSLDAVVVAGFGGSGAALGASGVAHALLPPHTSEPDQLFPPNEPRGLLGAAAGAAGFCWAAERLNTDEVDVVVGANAGWGAAAGGEDAEKSNKSPRAAEAGAAAGFGAAAGVDIEPQPEELPMDCFGWCVAAVGFESKKLPPLNAEKAEPLDWAAGRGDENEPRLANASVCAGLGDVELPKLKPLKASLKPPMEF